MSLLETEEAGLLIEEAACDRWHLEHHANNGSTRQWFDAVATDQTPVEDVHEDDEVESKGCAAWIAPDSERRRGRWWFDQDAHDDLLAAGGHYALGVYDRETADVLRLAMVTARTVDELLEGRWTQCGDPHHSETAAQLGWHSVFDSLDEPTRGVVS